MSRPRRKISPTGVPLMTPERALQLQVIRGVLAGTLAIDDGARQLDLPRTELERLVYGARQAVIASLGESALAQLSSR